jgi:UDP-GlcNAc:undecaprenyl-phosphate GlcNAc-1-phosphate transferase
LPGFFLALTLSLVLVPVVRRIALSSGWVDDPGERKIHQVPTPRLGGVAVWLAFMVSFAFIYWQLGSSFPHKSGVTGILAGSTLIFLLGLTDDLKGLSPYVKLMGQLFAAGVAFTLGVQVNTLDLPGAMLLILHGLSIPVTVLWLVGVANSLNFIDGVDGLASGIITISAVTLMVVAVFTNQPYAGLLACLLAGANLGFLVYNFHPARIFMGDSGALFSGFMLAAIAVAGVLKTQVAVMLLPVLVLSVPILDITYSTLRRLVKRQNPFIADADHIHHKLLRAGFSQTRTVWALYAVGFTSGVIASNYVGSLPEYLVLMGGVALLGLLLVVLRRRAMLKKTSDA